MALDGFNDTLLHSLEPQGQTALVPRLHSLKIITDGVLRSTDGKLLDMFCACMTSTRTVSFQSITVRCDWQEPENPSFHKLDFEGLAILEQQHSGLTVNMHADKERY